jgi:hypothetical protein
MQHTSLTSEFDGELATIGHYARYPEMMVAVGNAYGSAPLRMLVLGESHYLDFAEASNHPDLWYERREFTHEASVRNIHTRGIFDNAINGRKRRRSKAIFHSLANALDACGIGADDARSPLQSIAYMNFFQRPAQVSGASIAVDSRDVAEASSVVAEVASILRPQLIVFASRLAWRHAKGSLAGHLALMGIETLDLPHPATSWWNRPSGPMGKQTGRQRLISAVLAKTAPPA